MFLNLPISFISMYPLNHIKLPTVQGNWVSELTNRVHHICLIKVSFESDLSTSISLQPCLEFLYCRFVFEIVVRYTSEQIIAHFLLPHPRQGEDILWNLLKSNKWASLFSKNLKLIDTFHSFNNKTMLTFSSFFFFFLLFCANFKTRPWCQGWISSKFKLVPKSSELTLFLKTVSQLEGGFAEASGVLQRMLAFLQRTITGHVCHTGVESPEVGNQRLLITMRVMSHWVIYCSCDTPLYMNV